MPTLLKPVGSDWDVCESCFVYKPFSFGSGIDVPHLLYARLDDDLYLTCRLEQC
uniref:Bm1524 n=1 Tax=Brugia malayi TaxID=6279 RepID=A0A1I9G2Q8_BRUMA|nr:Bm1524 [Brugia malayi]